MEGRQLPKAVKRITISEFYEGVELALVYTNQSLHGIEVGAVCDPIVFKNLIPDPFASLRDDKSLGCVCPGTQTFYDPT